MPKTILIIGGYGVFGGRLAKALSRNEEFNVIVAGRAYAKAEDFCKNSTCKPAQIDLADEDLAAKIGALRPFVVIDAAGPYQGYSLNPYRVAEAALNCGAHYLDLSDDAEFTAGIGALEARAKAGGITLLSGVSSVPALSSAIAGNLKNGMHDVHLIESMILPGNRAPRGLSVMRSILGQIGRPLKQRRGNAEETLICWGEMRRDILPAGPNVKPLKRWSSPIGAPDLDLFPVYYNARGVSFRAGLDLTLMHASVWGLSWLVRLRILNSLSPLTRPLKLAADWLEGFGSSRGGMRVSVVGVDTQDGPIRRDWTIVVRDGEGPNIPAIPAQILCAKLAAGQVKAGARPCLEAFNADEAETALNTLPITIETSNTQTPPLFSKILGEDFGNLPPSLRDLHMVLDVRHWRGRARVERGNSYIAKSVGWLFGFPNSAEDVDVSVEMRRTSSGEVWGRSFGTRKFRSHLSRRKNRQTPKLVERFGGFRFVLNLHLRNDNLNFPVESGTFLGVPLPKFLLPKSEAMEFEDADGRANFLVTLTLPTGQHLVSYKGWLVCQSQSLS